MTPSPFQVSAISISPSFGQEKGSNGNNQKAGQIPGAQGRVSVAIKLPRGRERRWRETRRAEVYFLEGSRFDGVARARRTRRPLGVLRWMLVGAWVTCIAQNSVSSCSEALTYPQRCLASTPWHPGGASLQQIKEQRMKRGITTH